MMQYTCTKTDCYFCEIMNFKVKNNIPYLPEPYQYDVYKSGGYVAWRDAVLMENSKVPDKKLQQRLNYRMKKRPVKRKHKFFTEADNNYLIKNYPKYEAKKIAKIIGITPEYLNLMINGKQAMSEEIRKKILDVLAKVIL